MERRSRQARARLRDDSSTHHGDQGDMLDTTTGELVLEASNIRLGPTWTRTRFLASPLGVATPMVINEPWARYGIVRRGDTREWRTLTHLG
jgi:hypothetical protein